MLKLNSCILDCKKLLYSIYFNINNLEFFLATFTRFVNYIWLQIQRPGIDSRHYHIF
jgi:hypothetical protein